MEMKIIAKSGPTYIYNNNLPPFDFTKFDHVAELKNLHKGIPDLFEFDVLNFEDITQEWNDNFK